MSKLPNRQVLLKYIELYRKYRASDRASTSAMVKYTYEVLSSIVTRQDPVVDQIDGILKSVEALISTAKSFRNWYDLIFTLREKAFEAKKLKFKTDESVLHETLHAVASIIVLTLKHGEQKDKKIFDRYNLYKQQIPDKNNKKVAEAASELKNSVPNIHKISSDYENEIAKLKSQQATAESDISDCIRNRFGVGIQKLNQDLLHLIKTRALLGDNIEISNLAYNLYKMFDNHSLTLPTAIDIQDYKCEEDKNNPVSSAAPLCLQSGFCVWLYSKRFQAMTGINVSFDEFVEREGGYTEEARLMHEEMTNNKSDPGNTNGASHGRIRPKPSARHVPGVGDPSKTVELAAPKSQLFKPAALPPPEEKEEKSLQPQ